LSKKLHTDITEEEPCLSEGEASALAKELKLELQTGKIPAANQKRINLIVAGLGDRRGLIRRTFAESLGVIGNSAVPALQKALLDHSNVTVRRAAAKTLKLIGDPNALPALLEALINDEDPVVQGSAVGAMAIFGEQAVHHLLQALIDPKSTAMQSGLATWGLSFIGAEAPEALRKAAQSKNPVIKAAAIGALCEQIQCSEDEAAKKLVINALDDPAIEVRVEATKLIGKLDEPNWVKPLLIKKLKDSNSEVRKNAALSLLKLKATDTLNELENIYLLEQQSELVNVLKLVIDQLKEIKNSIDS